MNQLNIIGIYPVLEAEEPCHLVELQSTALVKPLDFDEFTQEDDSRSKLYWQVCYDENFLDTTGHRIIEYSEEVRNGETFWKEPRRFFFFFHYLDFQKKILSSEGSLDLPNSTSMPDRLQFIEYMAP